MFTRKKVMVVLVNHFFYATRAIILAPTVDILFYQCLESLRMDILLEQLLVKSVLHITLFIRDIMSRTVLSGSSFIFVNWKIHVYLPNFQCIWTELYFQVYRRFLLRLFARFNMYLLFVFLFQFIFFSNEQILQTEDFQFIFLSNENFPQIDGKFPVICLSNENFPQIDGKFSVHQNMNWKINTVQINGTY